MPNGLYFTTVQFTTLVMQVIRLIEPTGHPSLNFPDALVTWRKIKSNRVKLHH